jgi:23S rRNA (uracil1939-C5)-methyltransferase
MPGAGARTGGCGPLRRLLARRDGQAGGGNRLALADQGVDVAIKGLPVEGLQQTEALLDFARDNGLARLSLIRAMGRKACGNPMG